MAKNVAYKVLKGIDYPNGRVEVGDTVLDLPVKAIPDLLAIDAIALSSDVVEVVPVVELVSVEEPFFLEEPILVEKPILVNEIVEDNLDG